MLSNQLWLTAAAAAASGAFLFLNPPIDQFSTQFDQFGFKFDQSTNSPHNLTNLNSNLTNRPIPTQFDQFEFRFDQSTNSQHKSNVLYIFWKPWPTDFRLRFQKCVFANCTLRILQDFRVNFWKSRNKLKFQCSALSARTLHSARKQFWAKNHFSSVGKTL